MCSSDPNNPYIIDYKERLIHAQECTHNLQELEKEEIAEPEISLDEKEEESDDQKEEEWISYPCQPSNESNSLSLTLFDSPPCLPKEDECYVPVDSLELFPKLVKMIMLLLFMTIHAILINLMLILYLFLNSKCMVLKSFA